MCEPGVLAAAFEFVEINGLHGDYLEFGLWRGKTFTYAHQLKGRYRQKDMLLWGFDSFEGLPKIDDEKDNVWSEGQFRCGEHEFREILRRAGVAEGDFRLIKGFYDRSLNDAVHQQLDGRVAAIVYVDCDLYESTACVLNFVARYLVNGTIVCFDDWHCYRSAPDQGEQRALAEFMARHPQYTFMPWLDYCPVGKAFIVRIAG